MSSCQKQVSLSKTANSKLNNSKSQAKPRIIQNSKFKTPNSDGECRPLPHKLCTYCFGVIFILRLKSCRKFLMSPKPHISATFTTLV